VTYPTKNRIKRKVNSEHIVGILSRSLQLALENHTSYWPLTTIVIEDVIVLLEKLESYERPLYFGGAMEHKP
jgi:hypothetical protein